MDSDLPAEQRRPPATEEQPPTSRDLAGALATDSRLRVVAAVVLGARTPTEIAARAGLPDAVVVTSLTRLVRSGLVASDGTGFSLVPGVFAAAVRAEAPRREPQDFGVGDPKVAAILRAFIVAGRLSMLPARGAKRSAVLEYLVINFEPGRRYPEVEVNAILGAFHDDVASLRRALVDEGLLTRADGEYWRTGGWVDVTGDAEYPNADQRTPELPG